MLGTRAGIPFEILHEPRYSLDTMIQKCSVLSFFVYSTGLLLSNVGFADYAIMKGMAISGPVNCRDKPRGKVVKSIPDREKVTVLGRSGDWFEVRFGSTTCWTVKKNLKVAPAIPVPSEEIYGDGLSEEDDEFLGKASVPNPSLSEIIGVDGKPLSPTPTTLPQKNSN